MTSSSVSPTLVPKLVSIPKRPGVVFIPSLLVLLPACFLLRSHVGLPSGLGSETLVVIGQGSRTSPSNCPTFYSLAHKLHHLLESEAVLSYLGYLKLGEYRILIGN